MVRSEHGLELPRSTDFGLGPRLEGRCSEIIGADAQSSPCGAGEASRLTPVLAKVPKGFDLFGRRTFLIEIIWRSSSSSSEDRHITLDAICLLGCKV